jgi:hypothetical protein
MIHHTASGPSSDGWPDVNYCTFGDDDAPLCNLYLSREGTIYVCAAGATNTNGSGSDPCGVTDDDAMNSSAIGIEAGNAGNGEPWPDVQQDAYVALCDELGDAYGIPSSRVHSHFEWAPTRKTDPAGQSRYAAGSAKWDMAAFRSDVAADGTTPPEPKPRELGAIHDQEDPMFIAVKNGVYWIGNGLGRRKMADRDELDTVIANFAKSGRPLIDWQHGVEVDAPGDVTEAPQMHKLGVDVAP